MCDKISDKNGTLIQVIALVVTIGTLIWQQHKENSLLEASEARDALKLRIFTITKNDAQDEEFIVKKLDENEQINTIDKVEVRKAIYQMLVDKTISVNSDGKYQGQPLAPLLKEKHFEFAMELSKKWDSKDMDAHRTTLRLKTMDISKLSPNELSNKIAGDEAWNAALRTVFNYFHDIKISVSTGMADGAYLKRTFAPLYTETLFKKYEPWLSTALKAEDPVMFEDLKWLDAEWSKQ